MLWLSNSLWHLAGAVCKHLCAVSSAAGITMFSKPAILLSSIDQRRGPFFTLQANRGWTGAARTLRPPLLRCWGGSPALPSGSRWTLRNRALPRTCSSSSAVSYPNRSELTDRRQHGVSTSWAFRQQVDAAEAGLAADLQQLICGAPHGHVVCAEWTRGVCKKLA